MTPSQIQLMEALAYEIEKDASLKKFLTAPARRRQLAAKLEASARKAELKPLPAPKPSRSGASKEWSKADDERFLRAKRKPVVRYMQSAGVQLKAPMWPRVGRKPKEESMVSRVAKAVKGSVFIRQPNPAKQLRDKRRGL